MPRYIAFLRAINVGGRVVKMERLRQLCEEVGLSNVETFIASGNVIFEATRKPARALEKEIQIHLREALGFEVETFLRTDAELAEIAAHRAFSASEINGATIYVAFVAAKPSQTAIETLISHQGAIDAFKIHDREVYWLCRRNFSDSEFSGARLEKILRMPATVRNSTTVQKLAAKYPPAARKGLAG